MIQTIMNKKQQSLTDENLNKVMCYYKKLNSNIKTKPSTIITELISKTDDKSLDKNVTTKSTKSKITTILSSLN